MGSTVEAAESPYGVYVQDDAGVILPETAQQLYSHAVWLHDRTGTAQVGIVAVKAADLGNKSLENYAVDRLRQMGLGGKERNDGVLLLYVAGDEPHVRIEVGYGLEGRITDSKAGAILDQFFVPNMQAGQLDEAFIQTQSAIIREAAAEYGINASEMPEGSGDIASVQGEGGGWFSSLPGYMKIGIGLIVVLLFFLDFKLTGGAFTFAVLNMVGRRGGSSGGGGFGGGRGGGGSSGGGGASR
ncbi:TPM domain-containing protein [Paenibacillus baekrokdamisoli]|nr:TPM domain-containing protein [Paenibacillus baekrokdamisoli]